MEKQTVLGRIQTVDGQSLLIGSSGVCQDEQDSQSVDPQQVLFCHRWFGQAIAADKPEVNSYWLRHYVSQWIGEEVSSGALILAAHEAGFPIGYDPATDNRNVTIGVSVQCMNEYDCGCGG